MRIVAVTRVLNEDDIIEAFLRHHAAMVDHHVLLDNGSIDHTPGIIRRLHEEGLKLTLCSNASVVFQEIFFNSALYRTASRELNADWVVYLDCDEFIDLRSSGLELRQLLAQVPPQVPAIRLNMINYRDSARDDPADRVVPTRLRHRVANLSNVWKIFLRGTLQGEVLVGAGNHGATVDGQALPCQYTEAARLAHFAVRSSWQDLAKFVVGRLKVLATDADAPFNSHYNHPFELLLHRPAELLNAAHLSPADPVGAALVDDPIRYEGGALRYTFDTDYRMKAVQSILSYAERLARHHGKVFDQARAGGTDLTITRLL